MSTHPSVTTYMIGGRSNDSIGGLSEDNRGRNPPVLEYRHTKLSKTPIIDQNITTQIPAMTRNPIMKTQLRPLRTRADSSDRRTPHNGPHMDDYRQTGSYNRVDDRPAHTIPITSLWSFIGRLPQPADDQSIIGLVRQVFFLADNFVDNHYGDRLGQTIGTDHRFAKMEFPFLDYPNKPADVLFLIADPTIAIKHYILYLLLSCISFDDNNDIFPSLLPREFTSTESALRRSSNHIDSPEHFAALSAHRVLISHLRADVFNDAEYQRYLEKAIGKIGTSIETTFAPWQEQHSTEYARRAALGALMEKTAQLGLLLFAQSSTFCFLWSENRSTRSGFDIEICPRLLKINDEQASDLNPSQLMLIAKSQHTQYVEDGSIQNHLLGVNAIDAAGSNTGGVERYQSIDRGDSQQNVRESQYTHTGNNFSATLPTHLTASDVVELPGDSAPQLPELPEQQKVFAHELSALSSPEVIDVGARTAVQFHSTEGRVYVNNNGMPSSPTGNGSTRDAYSQQMNQRRKIGSLPPTASMQQFAANQSPPRKRFSRRRRSSSVSSVSSEKRGSESLSAPPQRRASISNDRTSMVEYGHRVPSDKGVLQVPLPHRSVSASSTTPHGMIDRALPDIQQYTSTLNPSTNGLRGERTDDRTSLANHIRSNISPVNSRLTDKTLRDVKEPSKWKKVFRRK